MKIYVYLIYFVVWVISTCRISPILLDTCKHLVNFVSFVTCCVYFTHFMHVEIYTLFGTKLKTCSWLLVQLGWYTWPVRLHLNLGITKITGYDFRGLHHSSQGVLKYSVNGTSWPKKISFQSAKRSKYWQVWKNFLTILFGTNFPVIAVSWLTHKLSQKIWSWPLQNSVYPLTFIQSVLVLSNTNSKPPSLHNTNN